MYLINCLVHCCEKVSKCIFDKNDKQHTDDAVEFNQSCEKVSKCIFDKNDKQRARQYIANN